jgi:hypothetical protein
MVWCVLWSSDDVVPPLPRLHVSGDLEIREDIGFVIFGEIKSVLKYIGL